MPFPKEFGGTGSMLSSCVAIEEFGRVCYNTAYLLVVQWTPFGAILAGGSAEQKERFLPGLANGKLRAAFSLTDHNLALTSLASRHGLCGLAVVIF